MLTLCIDTAYKYLSLALIRDDQLLYGIDEECFKHQSEMVFVKMQELFENAGIRPNDIDSICISDGPGSYTGVRIAMTIGKVIAAVNKIDLYTISTLQLYANGEKDTMVILDARAKRAYVGLYDGIDQVMKDQVCELDKIDLGDHNLYGDLYLFDKETRMPLISHAFLNVRPSWHKVENIDFLTPRYLKDNEAYHS